MDLNNVTLDLYKFIQEISDQCEDPAERREKLFDLFKEKYDNKCVKTFREIHRFLSSFRRYNYGDNDHHKREAKAIEDMKKCIEQFSFSLPEGQGIEIRKVASENLFEYIKNTVKEHQNHPKARPIESTDLVPDDEVFCKLSYLVIRELHDEFENVFYYSWILSRD